MILFRILLLLSLLCPSIALAETFPPENQYVLVKFKSTNTSNPYSYDCTRDRVYKVVPGLERWKVGSSLTRGEVLDRLNTSSEVAYAEAEEMPKVVDFTDPNDSLFYEQWDLKNTGLHGGTVGADIHALAAWNITEGDSTLKIGISDTGVLYDHPEFSGRIWTNPNEIPNNGIDDDNNGYIDDIHGWDAGDRDGDPYVTLTDSMYLSGHGTHVATQMCAVKNNTIGIAGLAKMALVVIKRESDHPVGNKILETFDYIYVSGVKACNNSWGVYFPTGVPQWYRDAIHALDDAGILMVWAAGNSAENLDDCDQINNGFNCSVPQQWRDIQNQIVVINSERTDHMYTGSSYGPSCAHLAAPGTQMYGLFWYVPSGESPDSLRSTIGWPPETGTSLSAPLVTATAALIWSIHPDWDALRVKLAILHSVDVLPSLAGKCQTSGRLNVEAALNYTLSVPQEKMIVRNRDGWYDITGRRLVNQPTRAGVYYEIKGKVATKRVILN